MWVGDKEDIEVSAVLRKMISETRQAIVSRTRAMKYTGDVSKRKRKKRRY